MIKKLFLLVALTLVLVSGAFVTFKVSESANINSDNTALTIDSNN